MTAASPPAGAAGAPSLLSVRDLRVRFGAGGAEVRAVDGVSFEVSRGEVLALVGESGSGKSITALSLLGLVPAAGRVESGEVRWRDRNLLDLDAGELRTVRGREIAMIFQDPMSSLNPTQTIGRQIGEVLRAHLGASRRAARRQAIDALGLVGFPRPDQRVDDYPHELSGGMQQRAMIAMAIACRPDLLIADEPTTALDVTVQAQVLDLLLGLIHEVGSAMLLITHDLGVVAGAADRVMVMYAGRTAETGTTDDVFYRPRHPYTVGLLSSLPRIDGGRTALRPIPGQPPSLLGRPAGCPFHPRCGYARRPAPCATVEPELRVVLAQDPPGHRAACHFAEEVAPVAAGGTR